MGKKYNPHADGFHYHARRIRKLIGFQWLVILAEVIILIAELAK